MPRDYKGIVKDNYYHVYNRGHNYQGIFIDSQDYFNLFKRLKILLSLSEHPGNKSHGKGNLRLQPLPKGSFDIIAYCLMPNHFHFVIKQNSNVAISTLINRLFTSYVKYFNLKYDRVGSIFQDTYKAKLVENDAYLSYLSAYIHNNPEEINSEYSSFGEYMNPNKTGICNTKLVLNMFDNNSALYKKFVINSKPLVEYIIEVQP